MKKTILLASCIVIISTLNNFASQNSKKTHRSPEEIGRLAIEELLSRNEFMMYRASTVKAVHYAEACAGYGAIKLAGIMKDTLLFNRLRKRYVRVIDENILNTANHVDVNVYGILPLEIYIQANEDIFFKQGIELADGQWKDTLPDGLTSQTRYWIDDIYMISSLQSQAFRATGNPIYLNRAAKEIASYIEKLQQPNGLFYHALDAHFYWGRGNGWVAVGMAELLSVLPKNNPYYKTIKEGYLKMMKTLLENQSEDGMWHQLIDNRDSFKETSSTAMFGFAMSMGVKKGLLPKGKYKKAYIKAWNALTEYLNDDGQIREVCVGTGQSQDINHYLTRPRKTGDLHGQAPLIWFAFSILSD